MCVHMHLRGAGWWPVDVYELCIRGLMLEPVVHYAELLPDVFSSSWP